MMNLEQYSPVGNDILVRVEQVQKTPAGLLLPKTKQDKVMMIVAVGSLVPEEMKPGTWVLVGPGGNGTEIPFMHATEGRMICVQTSVHSVIGLYKKKKGEGIVFMDGEEDTNKSIIIPPEGHPGPSNIIDNEGIEVQPFLKEQSPGDIN